MSGRVLHTGQAIADVVLQIPALPERGGDVYASASMITAGGGTNVMAAAARDGADVVYLGAIGTGPFARVVLSALDAEGVAVPNPPSADDDTGFSVALVDGGAERTFVTTRGAEARVTPTHLRAVDVTPHDVIYVSGYSLLHPANCAAIVGWLPDVAPHATVVFDPSPLIAEIPDDAWALLARRADVWTLNAREARLALARFGSSGTDAAALAVELTGSVVLRQGPEGAEIVEQAASGPIRVAGHPVEAIDTNGAGDAHTGVLAAALARGAGLTDAVRRANTAAAIAVTRFGPATSPTSAEIDGVLRESVPGRAASPEAPEAIRTTEE